MSTICLNKTVCQSSGVSLGEILLLLAIHNEADLVKAEDLLVQKGFITAKRNELFQSDGWRLTRLGAQILEETVSESEKTVTKTVAERKKELNSLTALSEKLKSVFPEGKKQGTNQYWAEGPKLIAKRLDKFFDKYGRSWTDEQIVDATQRYVTSFNGDYRFMRVLKYFLWKDTAGAGGTIEVSSDLYNYLTNSEQQEESNSNWMNSVR